MPGNRLICRFYIEGNESSENLYMNVFSQSSSKRDYTFVKGNTNIKLKKEKSQPKPFIRQFHNYLETELVGCGDELSRANTTSGREQVRDVWPQPQFPLLIQPLIPLLLCSLIPWLQGPHPPQPAKPPLIIDLRKIHIQYPHWHKDMQMCLHGVYIKLFRISFWAPELHLIPTWCEPGPDF